VHLDEINVRFVNINNHSEKVNLLCRIFLLMTMPIKLLLLFTLKTMILFDFNGETDLNNWRVIDDGVMGGLSQGKFYINEDGHGLFMGNVSLENNGGFSSVRYAFNSLDVSEYSKIEIRLKGDGKAYQFRVKATADQRYSYISNIATTGEWEIIHISFSDMYAAFRGRLLDIPNYSGKEMTEIAFLIGNKKEEVFALEIDYIKLQ